MSTKRYLFYIAQNYAYAMLRPLQAAILARGDQVYWFLEGQEVDPKHLHADELRWHQVSEVIKWRPDAVLVPGNVVPNFIPGIKVGVFHGFNSGKVNRRGREDHFEIRGCFDLYCTQGPQTTVPFLQLQKKFGYFQVQETGWPMLDPMFHENPDNPYVDKLDDRPTVLMCSTFSRNLSCAPVLFDEVKRMSQNEHWRWLVQFHPKMPAELVEKYKGLQNDNLTFIETDNVIPLLQAADVMLCDTSSILLMFLLLDKPVVTFRNQAPQAHLLNVLEPERVEAAIEQALSRPENLMREVNKFSQHIHPYRDGESSKRVLAAIDVIVESKLEGIKKKPMNLIRQLKMRKKLGYWKL